MFSHPFLQHVISLPGRPMGLPEHPAANMSWSLPKMISILRAQSLFAPEQSRKLEDKRAMAFSATSTSHQRRHQPHPKTFVDSIKALVRLMAHLPQWKNEKCCHYTSGSVFKTNVPKNFMWISKSKRQVEGFVQPPNVQTHPFGLL